MRPDLGAALLGTFRFGDLPPFPDWAPEDAVAHPLLTLGTTFGLRRWIRHWLHRLMPTRVGLHKWGMTGHRDIEAIRAHAARSDAIDYLPDDPQQVRRLRQRVSPLRWDVGLGALVLFIVTGAFMVSGAAVLFPLETRFEGWSLLTNQAHVWRQIHPSLVWIYYVCILARAVGHFASPARNLRPAWPKNFSPPAGRTARGSTKRLKRVICLYIFAAAMLIVWNNIPFDILTQIAGFLIANPSHCHNDGGSHLPQLQVARLLPHPRLGPRRRRALDRVLIASAVVSGWGLLQKLGG